LMPDKPVFLVVGSDSLIGSALFRKLREVGERVAGTTRRRENVDEHCFYLDLADASDKWRPPLPVSVAIVCAGVTRLQACQADPVVSARINVEGVSTLVKSLVAAEIFVVYLSTNQVFDGSKPFRLASDPPAPETEYGRQKAEAERRMGQYGNSVAIVRLTKVLEPRPPLFLAWIEALRNGREIHPFSDMVMAPVPLALVTEGLQCVAQARSPGVFQMSADSDITYEQAARHLARRVGAGENLIQPVRTAESGFCPGPNPAHTTLEASRFREEFGIEPPSAWSAIDSVLEP
jgi:dTDP-4-dehydrorhamnose reductase